MEAGGVLLLLLGLWTTSKASFYGDSIAFATPKKNIDGTLTVIFNHRENGRNSCDTQASFTCNGGVCTSLNESSVIQTEQDGTGQGRWCQSERQTQAIVHTNDTSFSLSASGCCWLSNVEGKTNWTSYAELNLGTRSDSMTFNNCPVTATVSSLRVPQNCFKRLHLLAHDPDGDRVKCSFAPNATVPANISLDGAACSLFSTGQVVIGVHVFELMLEDFPAKNITLTYANGTTEEREASNMTLSPFCKVKLQFSMEILSPIQNCEAGHVQPNFLSHTPSQGDVIYATVGQNFQLHARAQAHHADIREFQLSRPLNMTKVFSNEQNGKANVTLSWILQEADLHRFIPVCFTAETANTQSDMRCIVVTVIQSTVVQGKATVHCSPSKMVVTLEKASMPGIDVNYLRLRDKTCSLTSNNTHIIGTMSFNTCGTRTEDKGDFIVFMNEITSFELPSEVIVRRRTVKIDFFCKFPKIFSISTYFSLQDSDYIFAQSNFGSFGYTFDIYLDSNFTNKVAASAYPVQVQLLQTFYMGIQAQSEMPNVKLFVESCKGTPDDDTNNAISYELIKNGCTKDATLKVHPSNETTFNFEVQAFKFTGNFDQVYITCSVILCDSNSPFSRCAQGCLSSSSRRRRRGLSVETNRHFISQGPLQVLGQGLDLAARAESSNSGVIKQSDAPVRAPPSPVPPNVDTKSIAGDSDVMRSLSTMVFATLFVVSVVFTVVVLFFSRKKKTEDLKHLINHEDN